MWPLSFIKHNYPWINFILTVSRQDLYHQPSESDRFVTNLKKPKDVQHVITDREKLDGCYFFLLPDSNFRLKGFFPTLSLIVIP